MSSDGTSQPSQYRAVGVVLAIGSGVLIGSSFVFKKKGLLASQKGRVAGEGVAYLKSPMWWTGMIIMILGELCNFGAYAFVEAIIVTPMGALSVVISSILSHFLLKEKLSLFGWISSIQCLLGASILALNGPEEQSVSTIEGFKHLFLAPWFLAYGGVVIASAVLLAVWAAPKWGHKSMMPYLGVCSLIGGLSVSCTQGLGACIVTSIRGDNQFKNWFIYFLLVFVVITLLTEIYYLNVALALFNTAMVTPTYYVTFTFCTLVTSVILYQGLKASASQIITVVLAFAVICTGIVILQMTKVDPRSLTNVDPATTLLLEAARHEVDPLATHDVELTRGGTVRSRRSRRSVRVPSRTTTPDPDAPSHPVDLEAGPLTDGDSDYDFIEDKRAIIARTEEPGIDSLRMTGGAIGTIIRARRRATALSVASASRSHISSGNGSVRSHDLMRHGTTNSVPRRDSLSPPPAGGRSWFRVLTGGRADSSRSPQRRPSQLPNVDERPSEKEEKEKGDIVSTEVTGLPGSGLVDSPLSGSPLASDGLPSPSLDATRFRSSGDLVASPSADERPRRPSIRFQTSAPSVHVTPATPVRPSLSGEDAAATRSRTMPSVFTEAERVRAEEFGKENPPAK